MGKHDETWPFHGEHWQFKGKHWRSIQVNWCDIGVAPKVPLTSSIKNEEQPLVAKLFLEVLVASWQRRWREWNGSIYDICWYYIWYMIYIYISCILYIIYMYIWDIYIYICVLYPQLYIYMEYPHSNIYVWHIHLIVIWYRQTRYWAFAFDPQKGAGRTADEMRHVGKRSDGDEGSEDVRDRYLIR